MYVHTRPWSVEEQLLVLPRPKSSLPPNLRLLRQKAARFVSTKNTLAYAATTRFLGLYTTIG